MNDETLGHIADVLKEIWETLDSYNKRLRALEDLNESQGTPEIQD